MEVFNRRVKRQRNGLLKVAVVLLFLCNQFRSATFARVNLPEKSKQPNVLIILADDLGMIALLLQMLICHFYEFFSQVGVM